MKKILLLIGVVILIISAVLFQNRSISSNNTIQYKLENKTYRLLTAKTPAEWGKGLMYFRKLDGADGMIFIFPDKQIRSFWNKNTFMDLDLYWLRDDSVIGKSLLPSIEKSKEIVIVSSPDKANKVIEIVK